MGQSYSRATKTKSVLDENNNPLIYDEIKNFYYQPLWKKDSLYLLEFRIDGEDTSHKFLQKIDYVIGSGNIQILISFLLMVIYINYPTHFIHKKKERTCLGI